MRKFHTQEMVGKARGGPRKKTDGLMCAPAVPTRLFVTQLNFEGLSTA